MLYNFAFEFNIAIVQRKSRTKKNESMKKKSHTKHPDDGAAQEQSDLMQVGPNGCASDLQEIVGEFCQTLVGFYGKLRTFQTQIPKTPQR